MEVGGGDTAMDVDRLPMVDGVDEVDLVRYRETAAAAWRSRQGIQARGDLRCMICGLRWQRSDRLRCGGSVYMFPLPTGAEWDRWKASLKLPSRQTARRGERICSLHFRAGETRVAVVGNVRVACTLPVAAPKRTHFDERSRTPARPCSFPLCRGLRQTLLDVLQEIQLRGSALLRRTVRPYWSRRRFALPEPGPTSQAWVDLFTAALDGRPGVPDQVELSHLCALHFTPNWFRWENRGRPRLVGEPTGDPKLDKYAEPTIFSSNALIRALELALHEDLIKQQEVKEEKPVPKPAPVKPSPHKIRCGYPYCEGGTILFPLPAERDQRKLWLRSISAVLIAFGEPPGFDIKSISHLCSFHFNEEEIENEDDGTITLSAEAVPSRFNRPSVQIEEEPVPEKEPEKLVSWPDQVAGLISEVSSEPLATEQPSSDEEAVDVEEDSGFLPRLELQISVNPQTTTSTDAAAAEEQQQQEEEDLPEAPVLHVSDEEDEDDSSNWRRTAAARGRTRGRARGRQRGGRVARAPAPSAPPQQRDPSPSASEDGGGDSAAPPAVAAVDGRRAAAGVTQQVAALYRAAAAGHWQSLQAVDQLRVAAYQTTPTAAAVGSADQLLKLCLLRRLRRAAAAAGVQ